MQKTTKANFVTVKPGVPASAVSVSPEHKIVYSQVQQFSVSDSDVAISFLRNEPDLSVEKGQVTTSGNHWVKESTVYIPLSQAQALCTVLSETIARTLAEKNPKH